MEDRDDAALVRLKSYVTSICTAIFSLESADSAISVDSEKLVEKFCFHPDFVAFYVAFDSEEGVRIFSKVEPSENAVQRIAFIKTTEAAIASNRAVSSQLQVITLGGNNEVAKSAGQDHVSVLQQYVRHSFVPLIQVATHQTQGMSNDEGSDGSLILVSKRIRELDNALEQYQHGDANPKASFTTTPIIVECSASISGSGVQEWQTCMEKFNPARADQLFQEIGLSSSMGDNQLKREEFANEVNKFSKLWPQEVFRLIRMLELPMPSSMEKEMSFWKDLYQVLVDTKEQLENNPSILVTKLVLKRTNRVSDHSILECEHELAKAIDVAEIGCSFLKDFPLSDLETVTVLHPQLSRVVEKCLLHFSKLRFSKYDFSRAVKFLEMLAADTFQLMSSLLSKVNILQCEYDSFCASKSDARAVFLAWTNNLVNARGILKDISSRRHGTLKIFHFEIDALQKRFSSITEFRELHHKFDETLTSVLGSSDLSLGIELQEAYHVVLRLVTNILDVTPSGELSWSHAMSVYQKRLDALDEKICTILEGRLHDATSAEDMFRVFSTFNPLFFRSSIRQAVNSSRSTLVKNVREDVKRLQDKFRQRYDCSQERMAADLRDVPPLSGRIIWARQIERQLQALMQRMENVLGTGWEDHYEGKQLKEICDELRGYLDTNQLYRDWLTEQLKIDMQQYNRTNKFLLLVDNDPSSSTPRSLRVNFDNKHIELFKEVRYLEWLLPTMSTVHKTIPSTVRSLSQEANARYSVAVALQAALSSFVQAKNGITSENMSLLVGNIVAIRDVIKEAFGGSKRIKRWIKWDSPELNEWVGQFSQKVYTLLDRVEDISKKIDFINTQLELFRTCPFEKALFLKYIHNIQTTVDDVQMKGYLNVHLWVDNLGKKLEGIVLERLNIAVEHWTCSFVQSAGSSKTTFASPVKTRAIKSVISDIDQSNQQKAVDMNPSIHEILLSNQILYLNPPLEEARCEWIANFHDYVRILSSIPRVVSNQFQVFASSKAADSTMSADFSNVVKMLDPKLMASPFSAIEAAVSQAMTYSSQWLQYQALWDVSPVTVSDMLGNNIEKWQQLIGEIKTARSTIECPDEEKQFGPIIINFRHVQNKVNMKYDMWQRESQVCFARILLEGLKNTQQELLSCKSRLETVRLDGATKDIIIGMESLLSVKNSMEARKAHVSLLESSEKMLQKQRFQFPKDWFSVSNILGTFSDVQQIFERRSGSMESQLSTLQMKIKVEDAALSVRVDEFRATWEAQRPVEGSMAPQEALQLLAMLHGQVMLLKDDIKRISDAKQALSMDVAFVENNTSDIIQEMEDLKDVWTVVAPTWDKCNQVAASLMLKDIVPTAVRKILDSWMEELRGMPTKVRSYAAYEHLSNKIGQYLSFQPLLRDLCTEALKERHWKVLLKHLSLFQFTTKNPIRNVSEISIGCIWNSNALTNRKFVTETLTTAQGELALELFLSELKDYWTGCELSLALRDGGIRLIIGWDALFSQIEDHMNSLASLKQSPYFHNVPEFQENASSWDGRLTQLRAVFNVWLEVQRKWLYLRGIFKNSDIKAQLPTQYSKFKSVDNEFVNLMKKVSAKPAVMELLQMDNLTRQLDRQDASMTLIQKALGEYLERQRQIFPRFFFVNNDDLVEIIGNSNEPLKIVSHLGKMFAGMSSIDIVESSDSDRIASSMFSREGECVALRKPITISAAVKDWLLELEAGMVVTLAEVLQSALKKMPVGDKIVPPSSGDLLEWLKEFPVQIIGLSQQVTWTNAVEDAIAKQGTDSNSVADMCSSIGLMLNLLSESVLRSDIDANLRKKLEQLITEIVHQRDVTRTLAMDKVAQNTDFKWLYRLRYYWNDSNAGNTKLTERLSIRMSNASFFYGFEYLGMFERLVQTPLTDRCYLTLTQALHFRMGGNPFGPAGTGKTESVKMLGAELGRYVLVFNCDENFDYAAMGRIFSGLCQVGAWGCFDEFNRLEERILSAVSQQILTIQRGLMAREAQVELIGTPCKLHKDVGIFVTMNPGYAGRSNLPDNLKQLFRSVAMAVPNRKMIAQVMLFSQGIVSAEDLAGKIVLLFILCEEQLSRQSHYDFGLRALKSVLSGAGELKRAQNVTVNVEELNELEKNVLIKSMCNSVMPKLVAADIPLFTSLLQAGFPNSVLPSITDPVLVKALEGICEAEHLDMGSVWIDKILQLKQVLEMRHGVMMVGPSGTGKTTAVRTLLKALHNIDNIKGDFYFIDPKAIKKDKLYGTLDPHTLEWTDGIFTKILRKVIDAAQTRAVARRSWIVFDGDVDPEWAENLNSVLDDNKVLTLPSGDRLKLPPNLRIMMEVENLQHATLATVSRCGMVWFAEDTVTLDMYFQQLLSSLRHGNQSNQPHNKVHQETRNKFVECLVPHMTAASGVVSVSLEYSLSLTSHIMEASRGRLLNTLQSILLRGIDLCLEHNDAHSDFPLSDDSIEEFASKWLLYSLLWAFGGSLPMEQRVSLGELIAAHSTISIPSNMQLVDLHVNVSDGTWIEWASSVPRMEIESHKVTASDVVITTTDTVRHLEVISSWLSSHRPLILCGPPGSGKTMTLSSVIDGRADFILASVNFSSGTTPDLLMKTFAQYCETVDGPDGLVMQPNRQSYSEDKWLIIFCDEMNLPAVDKYGTQHVITFMRQLTEQGGFWRNDCKWVKIRHIQFVGACNSPSDAGRVPLSLRFMRHAPVLMVDYPTENSLKQIYRCFNSALLKLHPNLKGSVDPLTNAMVEFYVKNQIRFTPDIAPQYIYSPRELSRWVRAMYEAMEPLDAMILPELVRLWAHEAQRLFQDRLISTAEKLWCEEQLDVVARRHFPGVDVEHCLQRPLLYSNWLSKVYQTTKLDELREFVAARLKVFYEEELDIPLVVFDDVLSHVLRIDNVLRHPMGHLLLVGESGVGKTVLSRFVAWMNGLSIFQIKANNRYTLDQFDEDLRQLMRRIAIEGEKICFIFDESNALSSAFLERMNALLASGEVPGLFQGEELAQLLVSCREVFTSRDGLILDLEDELWRHFTKLIQRNLHVVFTMNPASSDFENRCTTSPALFNRCVVDWFGTWSHHALAQVAHEFTSLLYTGCTLFEAPCLTNISSFGMEKSTEDHTALQVLKMVADVCQVETPTLHNAVVAALVSFHDVVKATMNRLNRQLAASGRTLFLSPRDFLDMIHKFVTVEQEKRSYLEEQQAHIRTGLDKLLETQDQVATLQHEMVTKEAVLHQKDIEANEKLTLMVDKQKEAENRKTIAEKLTSELAVQNEEISSRTSTVQLELSEAEPALLSAKHSVQNIRKAQLDELRALTRPPNQVKMTLEMVLMMISGDKYTEWSDIRKLIRKDDFITTVVNFDPLALSEKLVKAIQVGFLGKTDEIDFVSVNRASLACGPLFQWAESQIKYAVILRKVKPLRDEVQQLQVVSQQLTVQQQQAIEEASALEGIIAQYKAEYAVAIRTTEIVRSEMEIVRSKVGRAESLLTSLNEEKDRWQTTWEAFDCQMSTLIGDCLLAAAFLTYAGAFDQKVRWLMHQEWCERLEILKVPFRTELEVVSFLSPPSQQLRWQECGLSTDELAMQNAILLERYDRFPLIIDPSGQALSFLKLKLSSQKLAESSFLDSSFLKTLASSIRFGTPLLIHDVENIDPILNPVLNKELQRTGGRTLIRLGNEEVDYSPKFMLYLMTRNPSTRFAPDLCSRVTVINFTVTHSSLESQALSAILKCERPDVDRRKTEMLRLQGEQNAKLRDLEETLLAKISAVQGAILDDDTVVISLEKIKKEASEVSQEAEKTEEVMQELKTISVVYEHLAIAMTSVYFSMEKLADIFFLYQFSLQFFMGVISNVLQVQPAADMGASAKSAGGTANDIKMAKTRVTLLTKQFYHEICRRTIRGLRLDDKMLFVARLAQISIHGQPEKELTNLECDMLYGFNSVATDAVSTSTLNTIKNAIPGITLDSSVVRNVASLSLLPSFTQLVPTLSQVSGNESSVDEWVLFLTSNTAEKCVPVGWMSGEAIDIHPAREAQLKILLVKAFRPERILFAIDQFINAVFGDDLNWRDYCKFDLKSMMDSVNTASASPIMVCSEAMHDVSNKVVSLSMEMNKQLTQVSMGSAEGFVDADRGIAQASKSGGWVLLRNVHLCPEWLVLLEKKLYGMASHAQFRIFLTCEISPNIPLSLLRMSDVVVAEASTGMKANLERFFNAIPSARVDRQPAERSRLYGLLAWLHAVIQERLRYAPLGWTKRYEFSEVDAQCALTVIDEWVDKQAGSRLHISPDELPWKAFQTILSESIYGGRIDNSFDQTALDSFIESVFCPESFSSSSSMVLLHSVSSLSEGSNQYAEDINILRLPERLGRQPFLDWIDKLPVTNSPVWLGLPESAEDQRLCLVGQNTLNNMATLRDEAVLSVSEGPAAGTAQSANSSLISTLNTWLSSLSHLPVLDMNAGNDSNVNWCSDVKATSLQRGIAREIAVAVTSLQSVLSEITMIRQVCAGEAKATNASRDLLKACLKGQTPIAWKCFGVNDCAVDWTGQWMTRFQFLSECLPLLSKNGDSHRVNYWLGGLHSPEGFITATRQRAAESNRWSLEDVELFLDVGEGGGDETVGVNTVTYIRGLRLECAHWNESKQTLELASASSDTNLCCVLPVCRLQWRQKTHPAAEEKTNARHMKIPLYLTENRVNVVSEVYVVMSEGNAEGGDILRHVWLQRGVSIVLRHGL